MIKLFLFSIACGISFTACGPKESSAELKPVVAAESRPSIVVPPKKPSQDQSLIIPVIPTTPISSSTLPPKPLEDLTIPKASDPVLVNNQPVIPNNPTPQAPPTSTNTEFQNVELYGNPGCGNCVQAEDLLKKKGINFTFTNIHTENQAKGQEIRATHNPKNYPYVFINGQFIGNHEDLRNRLANVPDA